MEQAKKSIEKDTMRSWVSYLSTLEHALLHMGKSMCKILSVKKPDPLQTDRVLYLLAQKIYHPNFLSYKLLKRFQDAFSLTIMTLR